MSQVRTTTDTTATAWTNQRKIARCSNGNLWTITENGDLAYSTDDGATWTTAGNIGTACVGASLFIDSGDYAHVVRTLSDSSGVVYYHRGVPNAGRTVYTWARRQLVNDNTVHYADVVAFPSPAGGWDALVVASSYSGTGSGRTIYARIHAADDSGSFTASQDGLSLYGGDFGYLSGSYAAGAPTYPSIDFNHTGDGKTVAGSTPHSYIAWTAAGTGTGQGVRFRKGVCSAGAWTFNAEREIDSTRYFSGQNNDGSWAVCMFDGTRVVIAGQFNNGSAIQQVAYDRDVADTTTTMHVIDPAPSLGNRCDNGSATYDANGNVYLFGNNATASPYPRQYRRWQRASGASEVPVSLGSTGTTAMWASAARSYASGEARVVYLTGSASPYSITYSSFTLNTAPNAPTSPSPANSAIVDRSIIQRLSWTFSDPDAGDSQSKFDLQWRHKGTTDAWNVVTQTTPNQFYDMPASTFPAEDIEWQVRTYDQAGAVGPYSSLAYFTAANPATPPTITAPTSGGTVSSNPSTVTWSASGQQGYQVRRVADNAGSPNTSIVYYDTGQVTDTTTRSLSVPFETNNRWEHVQVRIQQGGLWSAWSDVRVDVSYTPPAVPTLTATANNTTASILVQAANPTPSGGQPTVAYNDVYVRPVGDTSAGVRIAAGVANNGSTAYWTPASGVAYQFLVRAFGSNSTSADSAWTA